MVTYYKKKAVRVVYFFKVDPFIFVSIISLKSLE